MIRIALLLTFLLCLVTQVIVTAQSEDDSYQLIVDPDSVIIRAIPSLDGEFVASAFRGDILEAVGRNLDGTWFLVQRPGRMSTLGWISRMVINYDFPPEALPLTDFTTGAVGEFELTRDPGFAAFTLAVVNLRVQPLDGEAVITQAPFGIVLPVLQRDRLGDWVLVDYLGITGWVNTDNLRGIEAFETIPIASNLPEIPVASALIIPLEIQLSEIEEFRAFLTAQNSFAEQIAAFWVLVYDYEVMPCEPPAFVTNYLYNDTDERAFPELEYLVPRLDAASVFLNASIDPMYICGAKRPQLILDAKNAALNASIIYEATLSSIANIQSEITGRR